MNKEEEIIQFLKKNIDDLQGITLDGIAEINNRYSPSDEIKEKLTEVQNRIMLKIVRIKNAVNELEEKK